MQSKWDCYFNYPGRINYQELTDMAGRQMTAKENIAPIACEEDEYACMLLTRRKLDSSKEEKEKKRLEN